MDIRGVEITNQLRSAIRAKLLELGVRYDEELPDYILVMVVNKKTRQQMNEDLHLFLEDNTETFVNWLHDQVLKKLQKVTVAKKKSSNKDSVPLLPVKKEENQKKIKEEGKSANSAPNSQPEILTKQERDREFEELVGDLALLNEDDSKSSFKEVDNSSDKAEKERSTYLFESENNACNANEKSSTLFSSVVVPQPLSTERQDTPTKQSQSEISHPKSNDSSSHSSIKRKSNGDESTHEKNESSNKRSRITYDSESESNDRLKSAVIKPRITSVVSVKNRLGIVPSAKKPESQIKVGNDKNVSSKTYSETRKSEIVSHKSNVDQSKEKGRRRPSRTNVKSPSSSSRNSREKSGSRSKNDKSSKIIGDLREKVRLNSKSGTIKSRLGIINTSTSPTSDKLSLKSSSSTKVSKPRVSNVRSRLGVKVKPQTKGLLSGAARLSQIIKESCAFQDEEDDDAESVINTSLKSHIIAIQKPNLLKTREKISNVSKKKVGSGKDGKNIEQVEEVIEEDDEEDEDDNDQSKLPSKIIVTPRPLKPLQPFQKRATQSLLLRAVQEANKSVVMQKKIDPCLKEQKPASKIKITRDPKKGKVVAINLNSKKRIGPDRIQVELANKKQKKTKKSHFSQDVTEEDLDVVKSLFKRSDDKQKFLVTLNGYNNNVSKEKNSDDEEHLEMEVEKEDDFENQYEIYDDNDHIIEYIDEDEEFDQEDDQDNEHFIYVEEDDQNHDIQEIYEDSHYLEHKIEGSKNSTTENLRREESSSNKRKKTHSPIVYTRSRSNSPTNKPTVASTVSSVLNLEKRPLISSVITTVADKSSEKCRYWPNCTLGIKCAFYHPDVPCSSFPACKFGDKCAYKHPKCKFGSACTKLGCIFSHPPLQCKYHPYCMKPGCPFSHPKTSSSSSLSPLSPLPDISSVRAKFKWTKKE